MFQYFFGFLLNRTCKEHAVCIKRAHEEQSLCSIPIDVVFSEVRSKPLLRDSCNFMGRWKDDGCARY